MKWREKGQNRTRWQSVSVQREKGFSDRKIDSQPRIPAEFLDTPVECGHSLLQARPGERCEGAGREMNGYARRMVFAAKIRAQVQYLRTRQRGRNGRFIYPLLLHRRIYIYLIWPLSSSCLLQMNVSLQVRVGDAFCSRQMSALRPLNFILVLAKGDLIFVLRHQFCPLARSLVVVSLQTLRHSQERRRRGSRADVLSLSRIIKNDALFVRPSHSESFSSETG